MGSLTVDRRGRVAVCGVSDGGSAGEGRGLWVSEGGSAVAGPGLWGQYGWITAEPG